MNYLVFSPYYPPHAGGLENHAQAWNEHMADQGVRITVVTSHIPTATPFIEEGQTITVLRVPTWELIPGYPVPNLFHLQTWKIYRHLRHAPLDIIITRTRFFLSSILGGLYACLRQLPWVHIEHGSDYVHLHNPVIKFIAFIYDHTVGYTIFRVATTLVGNSQASARFIQRIYPQAKPIVIYRGIEEKIIHTITPHQTLHSPQADIVTITSIGRLMPGKGFHLLLSALDKIPTRNFIYLIVGEGPDKPTLEKLVKKYALENHVKFLGELSFPEVIARLKATDIFVHPSFTEGLPTVVIEAALCHCAIIATNVGGTREIVDHTDAILIPPHNSQALADNLTKLISNKNTRQHLGELAYAAVSSKFNWQTTIRAYQELFTSLG